MIRTRLEPGLLALKMIEAIIVLTDDYRYCIHALHIKTVAHRYTPPVRTPQVHPHLILSTTSPPGFEGAEDRRGRQQRRAI